VQGRKVIVSTDYEIIEEGFGEDYLGDYKLTLKIDLASFGMNVKEEELKLELSYNDEIIASAQKNLFIEQANQTFGNVTFVKVIPTIRISKDGSYALNLNEYFDGAESYMFSSNNINVVEQNGILLLTPFEGFKGASTAVVYAYSGETSVNSNEFNILVSSQNISISTSREKIKVGEPVKWTKTINLSVPEEISVSIPADAEKVVVTKVENLENVSEVIENGVSDFGLSTGGITGNVVMQVNLEKDNFLVGWFKKLFRSMTGNVVSDEQNVTLAETTEVLLNASAESYTIEYETPAPTSVEVDTESGKEVIVSAPSELGYSDVIAFANLNNDILVGQENTIEIFWRVYDSNVNESDIKEVSDVASEQIVNESNVIIEELSSSYHLESVPFDAYDLNGDGKLDYIEWVVPHLSEQTFEIIYITDALHLDSSNNVVENVFREVEFRDGLWTTIPSGDKIRVTFERNLTSKNDITIYTKSNNSGSIKVYEKDSDVELADFGVISEDRKYRILLTSLIGEQDVFDLKVLSGDVEFDYIVDPDTDAPNVSFWGQTPADGSGQAGNSIYVNVSSSDASDYYVLNNFDNSVVSWYRMQDLNSTGGVVDYMGRNNGTPVGNAVQNASGKWNSSFSFDGNGDYILVPDSDSLDLTDNFAISFWAKSSNTAGYTFSIGKKTSTWDQNAGFEIYHSPWSGGVLDFVGQGGNYGRVVKTTDLNWHHYVYIMTSGSVALYYDGVSQSFSPAYGGGALVAGTDVMRIASRTSQNDYTTGSMDELIFFNRSLSSQEILALYNASANKYYNNFTGLANGDHTMKAYAIDSAGNLNSTENRVVTIGDSVYPQFSSYGDNNNTLNTSGIATFNVTLANTNGTVFLQIGGANYSATNLSANVYNVSVNLNGGTYPYSWGAYGNGTLHNYNSSVIRNYFIWSDTVAPGVTIVSPTAEQNFTTSSVTFNVTLSENGSAWYTLLTGTAGPSVINNTVKVYYSFDNFSVPDKIVDLSQNANNATNTSSIQTASGKYGSGWYFDGADDRYDSGSSIGISGNNPWSISIWFNSSSLAGVRPLFYWGNGGTLNLAIFGTSGTAPIAWSYNGCDLVGNNTLTQGVWHNMIVTYNGAVKTIYIDGVNGGSCSATLALTNTAIKGGEYDLSGGWTDYVGYQDELLVFNRTLNSTEIASLSSSNPASLSFVSYSTSSFISSGNYTMTANATGTGFSATNSSVPDGSYTFQVYANDSAGNLNASVSTMFNVNATLPPPPDTSGPILTIVAPLNGSSYTASSSLTFDVLGDENLSFCQYSVNDWATNVSMTQINVTHYQYYYNLGPLGEGTYTARFWCNDTLGNVNDSASSIFLIDFAPNVAIVSPANQNYSTSVINFNVTTNENATCSYTITSGATNYTMTGNATGTGFGAVNSSVSDGQYTVRYYCADIAGNLNSSVTRAFGVDTAYPQVSLLYPTNTTYNSVVTQLNYSASDTNLASCWYSLNLGVTNTSVTCGQNVSGLTSSEGSNTWKVWVNDSAGNLNSSSVTFTYTIPDTTYSQFTNLNDNNNTLINSGVGIFNVTIINTNGTVLLSFNGTNYTATNSSSVFNVSLSIAVAGTYNYSWYAYGNGTSNLLNVSAVRAYVVLNDTTAPAIAFQGTTPADGVITNISNVFVNVSSSDNNTHYAFNNFDGSLVGYWRGENNGSDESGYGNEGHWGATSAYSTGKFGNAFSFGGGAFDYLGIWDVSTYNSLVDNFTISVWSKGTNLNYYTMVVSKKAGNANQLEGFEFYHNGDYEGLDFRGYGSSFERISLVLDTNWHHYVAVMNNGDVTIYYDGEFKTPTQEYTGGALSDGTDDIVIGSRISTQEGVTGLSDELIIFNRSLSLQEIKALYNASANQYYNNFTGLSEGNHTFNAYAVDTSGNSNNTGLRTVSVDTIYPLVSLLYPANTTYNSVVTQLNYSASDINLASCWYSLNSGATNTSVTCGQNVSGLTSSEGLNTWRIYVNDSAGNVNSSSVTFTFANTQLSDCGVLNIINGEYNLTSNLTSTSGDCLNVSASGISVNGNGYSINTSLGGNAIANGAYGVSLRNITLMDNTSVVLNSNVTLSNVNLTLNANYPGNYPAKLHRIIVNESYCSECSNFTARNSGLVVFNVSTYGNYTLGKIVLSQTNVSLDNSNGWNMFTIDTQGNASGDVNISLVEDWNLIGYSADSAIPYSALTYTASPTRSLSDSAINGSLQYYFGYYNGTSKKFSYAPRDDASLRPGKAYWVKANSPGNLTIPGAGALGGSVAGASYAWSDLMFSNGTTELNITNAYDAGWIGEPGGNVSRVFWYWDSTEIDGEVIGWLQGPADNANAITWAGYSLYTNKPNIKMLRED
ncbi:MAG: LamG domain-containing protein, partial [Nanoarchaeota archaeon]